MKASLAFYEALFQVSPTKVKPGYAKLESDTPAINLALNETSEPGAPHAIAHFGIEVDSTETVVSAHGRMRAAGFATMSEEGVTCCFAVADKVWIVDPDGHRWEVYVKHADADVHSIPVTQKIDGAYPQLTAPCCSAVSDAGAKSEAAESGTEREASSCC